MARNKIQDLRDHLFETIERLKDDEANMPVQKAKAISDCAQVIINTVKLEIDFMVVKDKMEGLAPTPSCLELPSKSN